MFGFASPYPCKKRKYRHTKNNSNKNIDLQKEKKKTLVSSEEQHYLQTLKISHKVTTAFFIPFSYKSLQNDNYDNLIIITVLIAPVPSLVFNAVFTPVFAIEDFQVRILYNFYLSFT